MCVLLCAEKSNATKYFQYWHWVPTSPLVIICSQIPKDILLWTSAVAKKTKNTWKKFWGDLPIAEICDKPFLQSLNWAENNRKVDWGMLETQHWGQIQLAKWKPMVICKPSCSANPAFIQKLLSLSSLRWMLCGGAFFRELKPKILVTDCLEHCCGKLMTSENFGRILLPFQNKKSSLVLSHSLRYYTTCHTKASLWYCWSGLLIPGGIIIQKINNCNFSWTRTVNL